MNRLAGEPSAYLRQHAQNPVHWQPFDDAAFAEAVARDVPIFLSVGYAACHWCHVMAGESFADPAIAEYLNQRFVSIKVDREERPDVDDAYMAATQALSGQGGWPMSVFLTPAGKAFYAGTYFPPNAGTGRPSFRQVLEAVEEAWRIRRDQVETTADALAQTLAKPMWQVNAAVPDAVELPARQESNWLAPAETALAAMLDAEDTVHGGFGQAPKFPPVPALEFLLRHAASGTETAGQARGLAGRTLGAMVRSALFDRLGGGFARYSVRADWSEPHYEKMLYDNAGLLQVLVHWIREVESRAAACGSVPSGSEPGGAALSGGTSSGGTSGGAAPGGGTSGGAAPGGGTSGGAVPGQVASAVAELGVGEAREAVAATVGWLMAEMRLPGGAFASSLDADTVIDGVHLEGASYRWSLAELQTAAREVVANGHDADGRGAEALAAAVARALHVGHDPGVGHDTHVGVGLAAGTDSHIGADGSAEPEETFPLHATGPLAPEQRRAWEMLKPALLKRRSARVMPGRDEKVVAAWNAMLLRALIEAAMVLDEPTWLESAVELGEYLHEVHWDGALRRVSHDGTARGIKGLLEDYAACASGFLALYAATGESRWFEFAGELVDAAESDFIADGVVFNHGAGDGADPLQGSRFADPFDNATTGGVALLAEAFLTWSAYTGSTRHRAMAESMLAAGPQVAARAPRSAGGLLGAGLALAAGPLELAIVGREGAARDVLVRAAWAATTPGLAIAVWDGAGSAPLPLFEGRSLNERTGSERSGSTAEDAEAAPTVGTGAHDVPLAYVCREMVCARPVSAVDELRALLR